MVQDFYEFQWNLYAKHIHYLGATIHLVYCIVFVIYVNQIYLDKDFHVRLYLCWAMLICIMYPLCYDTMQMFKCGLLEYLSDPWNYIDLAHIWVGIANAFVQRFNPDILSMSNTFLMVIVALILMVKTFFFLRIF